MSVPVAEKGYAGKIEVRDAVAAAAKYFKVLYPGVSKFSLEEVEMSDDERHWLITLGFPKQRDPFEAGSLFVDRPQTKFKVFKIDARTGRVVAMKIRKLE